ncbi:hypothetical protein Gpo141_00014821, partial [Globisporangium polare]
MCSRCRVTMKLGFPRPGEKDVRLRSVVVCKKCITNSSQQSTFEIAQQEVLSGRYGSLSSVPSSSSGCPGSLRPSAASTASIRASGDIHVASSKAATVVTTATTLLVKSEDIDGSSILHAQALEYAQSSVRGAGGTILSAHALDRKKSRAVSEGAAYLSSLSVSSSMADTTKSSVTSDFSSYYSESGGYESLEDLPDQSDDDDEAFAAAATTELLVVDHSGAVTSDWSAVSPAARQKYLDTVQGRTPEEQAMWKRMAQLHLQAESLYQFTKKNTESLLQSNPVG